MHTNIRKHPGSIAIGWSGLPTYAARLIAAGRREVGFDFSVLATRPEVPCTGIEELLPHNLHWIEKGQRHSWSALGLEVPQLFIHSGWRYPHFISLANEVRSHGGRVVGMFDNNRKRNLRQLLGGVFFRFFQRRKYHAVWVPGASGTELAKAIGFGERQIHQGLYGADPSIFFKTTPMLERPKTILYVGQFVARKNIVGFSEAFERFRRKHPEWSLRLIGCGPLEDQLANRAGVSILPFSEPATIAAEMNQARFVVLPSFEEHWGMVIHEACLCACGLLLSDKIGAFHDLANARNALAFESLTPLGMLQALDRLSSLSDAALLEIEEASSQRASEFGPARWAESLLHIVG